LRVAIADDHQLFRQGLRGMLEEAGMEVVGEASDGAEAAALAQELRPDVVVLDLNMPGTSGIQALRRIARNCPDVQTVVLTVSAAEDDVLEALAGGACGYLLKDAHPRRLAEAIRQAAEGQALLSHEVARALAERVRADAEARTADAHAAARAAARPAPPGGSRPAGKGGSAPAGFDPAQSALTPRECDVLRLIVEGEDNVAIGEALSISRHTVKQHVTNIFEKLEVSSRVQAAVHAVRAGLV
jgi:DNA-binding NarL/FixJ family response regulator